MSNGRWASRFLDTVGDGTGSINMAVNGASTPVVFKYTAPEGYRAIINRIIIAIKDSGSIDSGLYGNGEALDNGVTFGIIDKNGVLIDDMTYQLPIKVNTDYQSYCHDVTLSSFGSGDSTLTARYTFTKDGAPITIESGNSYAFFINDNLFDLSFHTVRVGATYVSMN